MLHGRRGPGRRAASRVRFGGYALTFGAAPLGRSCDPPGAELLIPLPFLGIFARIRVRSTDPPVGSSLKRSCTVCRIPSRSASRSWACLVVRLGWVMMAGVKESGSADRARTRITSGVGAELRPLRTELPRGGARCSARRITAPRGRISAPPGGSLLRRADHSSAGRITAPPRGARSGAALRPSKKGAKAELVLRRRIKIRGAERAPRWRSTAPPERSCAKNLGELWLCNVLR